MFQTTNQLTVGGKSICKWGWSSALETPYMPYDVQQLCPKCTLQREPRVWVLLSIWLADITEVCLKHYWNVFVDDRAPNFEKSSDISVSSVLLGHAGPVNCPSRISGEPTGGPRQSYPSPLLWHPPPWCQRERDRILEPTTSKVRHCLQGTCILKRVESHVWSAALRTSKRFKTYITLQ